VEQMGPPQELYEHPATPFVTGFLGSVNVLKVETVLGMDLLGDEMPLPLDVPGPDAGVGTGVGTDSASAGYVRPPDFAVARTRNGRPAWTARIRRLTHLGGLVRLDLVLLDGTSLHVQMTRERCRELGLADGEDVYVTPKDLKVFHESKAFVENYVI